jgi:hypothetical protein
MRGAEQRACVIRTVRGTGRGLVRFYGGRMWNYYTRPLSRKNLQDCNLNYYYYHYYLYTHPYLYYFSNRWTRMIDTSDSLLHVSVHCKSLVSQMPLQGTKKTEIAVPHTATC